MEFGKGCALSECGYWRVLQDVQTACVKVVDENLDTVEGYKEFITHKQED